MNQVLPKGWFDTKLGSIIDYGKAAKKTLSDVEPDSWILELEDIEKNSSKLLKFVTASERPFKSTKNTFKKGDVLYGKLRPYLNKVIVAIEDGVCTTEIIPINSEPYCLNKYMFYWVKCSKFLHYVDEVSHGVNMPRLGTSDGKSAPFRLAPLDEQKEIVAQLDKLMAQVESTKTHLDAIPAILKSFRQSVLSAAVSGKLTKEWRENNKHSKLLIEEKYIFDNKYTFDVPNKWLLTAIGNVSRFQQGLQIAKSSRGKESDEGVMPILRTVNYENDFKKDVQYAFIEDKSIIANPEDIILSRTGTVGRVLTGFRGIMHNNSFRINYKKSIIIREFLVYFLTSPICQNYVKENSGRSTQPDLTHKAFSKCPLPLPCEKEQIEIVRRVEELFVFADKIEAQVNVAQERVNNLSQSLLAKAFSGELTAQWRAQNPELIAGEKSAEALLEKIKAERSALTAKKKPAKKTTARKAKA